MTTAHQNRTQTPNSVSRRPPVTTSCAVRVYHQPRPSPTAKIVKPEQLELMWRLQEMRDAGDLILQFGWFKGTTLAQVAINHPKYIRQLVTRARRPQVRAEAGRLVEALDAAAERKRRTPRGTTRRGRSTR